MREFCLTLLCTVDGDKVEELVHLHVEATTQDEATAVLLKVCVDQDIDVTGCRIAVLESVEIPDDVVRYHTEARRLNRGTKKPSTAPDPAYWVPASPHVH